MVTSILKAILPGQFLDWIPGTVHVVVKVVAALV